MNEVIEADDNKYWDQDETKVEAPPRLKDNNTKKADLKRAQMWAQYGDTYVACEKAVKKLEPGQYIMNHTESGVVFNKHEINIDKLIKLPDSASDEIIQSIELFWTKEEHFRAFNFLWKRGILMWGPPGSGKTSTLQMISKIIIQMGGIAFYVTHPQTAAKGLEIFRKIEPDRPVLVMLEDLDAIVRNYGESDLLALLDGELQIDNVVFIATTNYPEQLDKRIINRPSRFDIVKHVGMPSAEARKIYLQTINPRLAKPENGSELENWVKQTNEFSIAHLKEVIISVEVFEVPFNDVIDRLKKMSTHISSDDDSFNKIGFN